MLGSFTVTRNADMKYLIARLMKATYLQLNGEKQDTTACPEAQLKDLFGSKYLQSYELGIRC
jgi:hypothetical protein